MGRQDGIPRSLAPFFQEYDLETLDPEQAAATIIERTLRYGSRAELRWLFARYPRSQIAGWVRRWGRFGLPAPHLAFWRMFLQLEDEPESDSRQMNNIVGRTGRR